MATLSEIIANAQMADNMEFTDPSGVKFSMADLRSLSKMAEGEKATAAQKRGEAERLAAQAATLLASLQEQAEKATKQQAPPAAGEDWRKDPFYQPVATEFDKFNAVVEKLNTTIAAQQKALDNAQAIYALERMRGQFNAKKDVLNGQSFEELAKQAVAGKHVDAYGLPTLDPLIEKLTEPTRIKSAQAEAVAAARKEWEKEQAVSATQKPGSQSRFRNVKTDAKAPIAKIEDLNSDAIIKGMQDDPEFRAQMEGPLH